MAWHIPFYGLVAGDRVLHNAGLGFDMSMSDTWPTLAAGACLYPCTDNNVRMVPSSMLHWMADQQLTLAFLTTQVAEAVLALEPPDHLKLRCLYTAGEALHRGASVGTPYRLVNAYGPTESYVQKR